MKYVFVDVESDGPCPGENLFSMVCFGAVIFDKSKGLEETFYGKTAPISNKWFAESLAISGFTREQHEKFESPSTVMQEFDNWVRELAGEKPSFITDNLAYDWCFMNYYLHTFVGINVFGYSGRRLSDIICGFEKDMRTKWKHKKNKIDIHDPVFDAIENAKIFEELVQNGLKL
jgi:hypothetical protein